MDKKILEQGIVKYGTPLYVFNIDEMRETVALFREKLEGSADICFAMKANPFLTRQMAEEIDRIEVCSMGEFEICRKLGISAKKILISGVLKKKEDIYEILMHYRGNCLYTVESPDQFQTFVEWCDVHKEEISIYLRLTSGNQFGMDEKMVRHMLSEKSKYPFLKIQGIHYFSGTQKKTTEKIKQELTYLDNFLLEVESSGLRIKELEYGPGIAVRYFQGQKDTLGEDIAVMAGAVRNMNWHGNVVLEMGRALAAKCGYYLTSVKDIKCNNGRNYCILDGGIHQINYDGQIRGMYCPNFQVTPGCEEGSKQEYVVCGSLCTVNDILMQKVEIADLQVGNVLIFEQTGAYAMTEGMALFLSHELPQIAFYEGKTGWKLVRDRHETYEWNMEKEIK